MSSAAMPQRRNSPINKSNNDLGNNNRVNEFTFVNNNDHPSSIHNNVKNGKQKNNSNNGGDGRNTKKLQGANRIVGALSGDVLDGDADIGDDKAGVVTLS